jgi:hypothetical protein
LHNELELLFDHDKLSASPAPYPPQRLAFGCYYLWVILAGRAVLART